MKTLWANLLRFVEPPSADPHARWCGEGGQRWPPLPDYPPFDRTTVISIRGGTRLLSFSVGCGKEY